MLVSVNSPCRHRLGSARWVKTRNEKRTSTPTTDGSSLIVSLDGPEHDIAKPLPTSALSRTKVTISTVDAPTRFGRFGGQFAPELQMDLLLELPNIFHSILSEQAFWNEFFSCNLIRSSPLQRARRLTKAVGGANIWLKREDLNPFGSYQTRNIIGQVLFAQRIGKTEAIMECGYAGHGLVCATMCASKKMKCTIFIGASDAATQLDAVEKMEKLGATVVRVQEPDGTLRAATNEALRYSLHHLDFAYYISSGTVGPHPLPTIARTFQSLLGQEIKDSFPGKPNRPFKHDRPDAFISHMGSSGSASLGMFAPFIDDHNVRLIAVEAANTAPLTNGSVGVMYGCKTLLLQDDDGQILPSPSHSLAPDMNFPCAGPELAHWKDIGRLETGTTTSEEATWGSSVLRETEGIIAGLATGHAILETVKVARELGCGKDIVLLVSR
ncbi:tryptophan synthase [Aspergillus stella-maris]|uniref:tryptophan synthase n=1 Tax=Aspergillus stella-maris TaxID=1810926 RepID=UPI003CCD184C